MDEITATMWIQACAHCLQKKWRTVDPVQLEEVARELLDRGELPPMAPAEAAALWLQPIQSSTGPRTG